MDRALLEHCEQKQFHHCMSFAKLAGLDEPQNIKHQLALCIELIASLNMEQGAVTS
jgi:hypothetical protein